MHSSFDYEDTVLCPECGAPKVHGMNCWEQLGALLGWEFDDPELQAEHFLTVACYNLQHPAQFTEHALNGLRAVFIDHLDNGLPVKEIRKRVSKTSEGKTRVLKEVTERYPVQRQWAMTIANVYTPSNPEGAAKRVKEWATVIRQEL